MSSLLDHKDAKNIIIWLFVVALGLAVYIYQEDQKMLRAGSSDFKELITQQSKDFRELVKEECGDLKTLYSELKSEQKEIRTEQRVLIVDVAKLNAIKEIKDGDR